MTTTSLSSDKHLRRVLLVGLASTWNAMLLGFASKSYDIGVSFNVVYFGVWGISVGIFALLAYSKEIGAALRRGAGPA